MQSNRPPAPSRPISPHHQQSDVLFQPCQASRTTPTLHQQHRRTASHVSSANSTATPPHTKAPRPRHSHQPTTAATTLTLARLEPPHSNTPTSPRLAPITTAPHSNPKDLSRPSQQHLNSNQTIHPTKRRPYPNAVPG
ncbi:hypothetical protein PSE_3899 [Pseudovibrio sp. FO-BEG1]|nr:hypothetical protein PSE_3899 [Pseudovibrio sp. FO-BEG1]